MPNITLSVDDEIIKKVRKIAIKKKYSADGNGQGLFIIGGNPGCSSEK